MKKSEPAARRARCPSTRSPTRSRSRPRTPTTSRSSTRASSIRCRRASTRSIDDKSDSQPDPALRARRSRSIFTIAIVDPAHLGGAADREHDPALDLLAPARDRGDEARRGDELVRARAVHDRGPALRARRRGARGRCCSSIGKEVALPAILHNALSTDPGVHALAFPLTALILLGIGLALGAVGSGVTVRRFLQV